MMVSAQTLAAFDDRLINLDLGQRGVEQLHATAPQPPLRCSEANLLDRQRASRRDNGMRTVSVDRREPVEPTPLSLDDGIIAALADRSLPSMELARSAALSPPHCTSGIRVAIQRMEREQSTSRTVADDGRLDDP